MGGVAASIASTEFNMYVASGYFGRMYDMEHDPEAAKDYSKIAKKAPDAVFDARVYTIRV